MANASDEYFKLWLRNEIDIAQRSAASQQAVIDRQAAHKGKFKSGNRIVESINLISSIILPLAEKAYEEAVKEQPFRHRFEIARGELDTFADLLAATIPPIVRSTGGGTAGRTVEEANKRVNQVLSDLRVKSDLARLRIEAKEEADAARNARDQDDADLARFRKLPRWELLPVLAWIATGDLKTAYRTSQNDKSIEGANISLIWRQTVDKGQVFYATVEDAWVLELCSSLSDGRISGSGSLVSGGAIANAERRQVGLMFPPSEQPRQADGLELLQRKGQDVGLAPKGSRFAHEWTDWRDLVFPTARVLELWPATRADHAQGATTARAEPVREKPISEKQLNTDFAAYLSSRGSERPTRPEVRAWVASTYGGRVTVGRADALYAEDVSAHPRKRGRRPGRAGR